MTPLDLPAPFACDFLPGAGGVLLLAFASVGHDPDRMPAPEFAATARALGLPAVLFRDQSRSWASGAGWADALRAAVGQVGPFGRIVTLGVSMGAVSALRAAEVLAVDAVLAIGPQARLAGEGRWARWTAGRAIPDTPLPPGPWIVLAHGMADDADQALAFPLRRGVDHLLFQGLGHSALAPHLRAHGLSGMIAALVAGDRRRLLRLASAAGASRRQEPR